MVNIIYENSKNISMKVAFWKLQNRENKIHKGVQGSFSFIYNNHVTDILNVDDFGWFLVASEWKVGFATFFFSKDRIQILEMMLIYIKPQKVVYT